MKFYNVFDLGGINLFVSHFVIGCRETNEKFTKTKTIEIKALQNWLKFKDEDSGMKKYHSDRTMFIDYPNEINLTIFETVINDLYNIYLKKRPYSQLSDFKKEVFEHSIIQIEDFISSNCVFMGSPFNKGKYIYFSNFLYESRQYVDYGLTNDIDYYKQYFKKVLKIIKDFKPEVKDNPNSQNDLINVSRKFPLNYFVLNDNRKNESEIIIENLYKELNGKFIKETSIEYFKKIFSGEAIDENDFVSIEWIHKHKNYCPYLFECLFEIKLITNYQIDKKLKYFFGISNSAQMKSAYFKNKLSKPKNFELIDEIIYNIKKPFRLKPL